MNPRLIIALILVLATLVPATGQVVGPKTECQVARETHLYAAMAWSERADQAYHLGAAEAARLLANDGASCAGWDDDARAPSPTAAPASAWATTAGAES